MTGAVVGLDGQPCIAKLTNLESYFGMRALRSLGVC